MVGGRSRQTKENASQRRQAADDQLYIHKKTGSSYTFEKRVSESISLHPATIRAGRSDEAKKKANV